MARASSYSVIAEDTDAYKQGERRWCVGAQRGGLGGVVLLNVFAARVGLLCGQ